MSRASILAVAIAVLTLGLAAGALALAVRNDDLERAQERARWTRAAHAARAAIEEGLEGLRAVEDARPFYLYNRYYSPPDLVSLGDAVALSPLAAAPSDPRVKGYAQLDPGGEVRGPRDDTKLLAALTTAPFDALRARATLDDDARSRIARYEAALARYEAARSNIDKSVGNLGVASADNAPALVEDNPNNVGSYTVSLNGWSNQLYEDLKNIQQNRVDVSNSQVRSRAAPRIKRRDVDAKPKQKAKPKPKRVTRPAPLPPSIADEVPLGPEVTVDYSPMRFVEIDDQLFLVREVSHQGVTSVQLVMLNRAFIEDRWMPSVLSRHAAGAPLALVASDKSCALALPATARFGAPALCIPDAIAASAAKQSEQRLLLQVVGPSLVSLLVILSLVTLSRLRRRERALSSARSDFVSAVSHELRTPLTTLRMNAEMLKDGLVAESRRGRFLDNMVGESMRLSNLVENVLEISRMDQGKRPMKLETIALDETIERLAASQRALCQTRGFELELSLSGDARVRADLQALEQIVVNLVENAVKYAKDHGPQIVTLSTTVDGAHAVLSIADRGPGIDEKDRAKVFERFFRAEGASAVTGTGLGLALVKDLAEAQSAAVSVHDGPEGGAEIRVRFPLVS